MPPGFRTIENRVAYSRTAAISPELPMACPPEAVTMSVSPYPEHRRPMPRFVQPIIRSVLPASIALLAIGCLFLHPAIPTGHSDSGSWAIAAEPVRAKASYAEQSELDAVRHDLEKIDGYIASGGYDNASAIVGRDIRARDVYHGYIKQAAGISVELVSIRPKLSAQGDTLTLQQLGALAQRLTVENAEFRNQFRHGENNFQTYHLIETAITNFEDAIRYWRLSNHFRKTNRGSARERSEDDEILRIKLQTAMNAIDELKIIIETRETLERDLEDGF